MQDENKKSTTILEQILQSSDVGKFQTDLDNSYQSRLSIIVDNACSGGNKAVLAVIVTLLLKKMLSSEQDIRLHQKNMDNGFSGRGLDQRIVTPFLRDNKFPYMQSGSGWLTRSLEQNHLRMISIFPLNLKLDGMI